MDGLRLILIFVVVLGVSGTVPEPTGQFFNCRHKGQEDLCDPGVCAPNGTYCVCTNSDIQVQDVHCVRQEDATTSCNNPCNDNGTCFTNSNGTDVCYCHQLYTGSECQTPRAQVFCNAESMTVLVRPHGIFMGLMFANGFDGINDCKLEDDGAGTWNATFSLVPGQNTSCGVTNVSGADGDEFQSKVRVRYHRDIYVHSDQLLTFTCFFSNNVTISSPVRFEVDAPDDALTKGTGDGVGVPLRFTVSANDAVLQEDEEVDVGVPLTLAITLQRNEAFDKLLVTQCTASNRHPQDKDNPYFVSLPIVIGGCPANSSVIAGDHEAESTANGGQKVKIYVYAFVFVKGSIDFENTLYFSCQVLLCANDSSNCDPPTCTGLFQVGLGRRRRSVSEEMVTVGQKLIVRFSNSSEEELIREGNNRRGVTQEECLKDPHLQTLLIAMGVALLALLIVLLVVLLVLCRRRRRRRCRGAGAGGGGGQEGRKGKGEDGQSTTCSTSTLHMHIPRPKLM